MQKVGMSIPKKKKSGYLLGNGALSTTDLNAKLGGIHVSADFLISIGQPPDIIKGAMCMWYEFRFADICRSISQYASRLASNEPK